MAESIKKKAKRKKVAKKVGIGTAAIGIGALVAAPFTGGASVVAGATAMGLTIGSLTITTAELAILVGGGIAFAGIMKDYKVKFNSDGSVELSK